MAISDLEELARQQILLKRRQLEQAYYDARSDTYYSPFAICTASSSTTVKPDTKKQPKETDTKLLLLEDI